MNAEAKVARRAGALELNIRLRRGEENLLGPGKIALLDAIAEHGSISAAGRRLGMSYRRAWLLVEAMNESFALPLVEASHGGARGGGAALTADGRKVLRLCHAIERKAAAATRTEKRAIERMMRRR